MKQYKITSQDLLLSSDDDCYLDPNDPIYKIMGPGILGGIFINYAALDQLDCPTIQSDNRGKIQKEQNIKPGTEEWFKLWFSR